MQNYARKRRNPGLLVITAILAALLAGCASSAPSVPLAKLWRTLPEDQSLYFSARLRDNGDLIKSILQDTGNSGFSAAYTVDKTDANRGIA